LANLTTIGNLFDTKWVNVWSNYGATGQTYRGSITTDWSSSTGLVYNSVGTFSPIAGTNGESFPPNVAILISFSNGVKFKGGHFRTYLPWVGRSSGSTTDPSLIITTVQSNISTQYNATNTALVASGVLGGQSFALYGHRNNVTKAQVYAVQSYTVNLLLASQRRRMRRAAHK
jgi:hypothetical protein